MYNCQSTIKQVLICLQKQNFPKKEFEIICVDDKSKDKTIEIVKKTKVRLIKLFENKGNGRAKNLGVRKAKGEILLFIDDHLSLDKNTLFNLDSLFRKHPHISGVCGYYEILKKLDLNICRDIRRRTIYGKDNEEREISLESFSPFSIGIGAVRKKIFKDFKFSENFGKNSAEDTLFQIDCLNKGKVFLYSPKIRGIHDHDLDFKAILEKLIIEIRGVGDLLTYSTKRKREIPFQPCFLSYPLFLLIGLGLLWLKRLFLPFFFAVFIEVALAAQCLKDKKAGLFSRFLAFVYCLSEEIIKGLYLPCYLIGKTNFDLRSLISSYYQFLKWEKEKLAKTLYFLFEQRLKYAKI